MVAAEHLRELAELCGGAQEMPEGGRTYIYLNFVQVAGGIQLPALLCIQEHSGYSTRLFLPQAVPGRGANWSTHFILGRNWYSWSWQGVPASLRPAEMLAAHLRPLR
jgi:hypothetical protein